MDSTLKPMSTLNLTRYVVYRHRCQMAVEFDVIDDEDYGKLPKLNCLPNLHTRQYLSWFNFNGTGQSGHLLCYCLSFSGKYHTNLNLLHAIFNIQSVE